MNKKGLASVKTPSVKQIAKKHHVSLYSIIKQLRDGAKIEGEHTRDSKMAHEIARDHLGERPDYYKKIKKMEKSKRVSIKEEISTGDVRGLGFVSGDPAGKVSYVDKYVNTNTMSYADNNGNLLDFLKRQHIDLHNSNLGYKAFDPTRIGAATNFSSLKEQKLNELGDYVKDGMPGYEATSSLSSRVLRKNEVKEQGPVYTRYNERPTYENKDRLSSTEAERGIYEKAKKMTDKQIDEIFDTPKGKERGKEYVHKSMMHMYQQGRSDEDEIKRRRNLEANPALDQSGKQGEKARGMHDRTMKKLESNWRRQSNRIKYVPKALDRLAKEDYQLDEISQKTKMSYISKSDKESRPEKAQGSYKSSLSPRKEWNRAAGRIRATNPEEAKSMKLYKYQDDRKKMDESNEMIKEAFVNIVENNLVAMRENFMAVLQEKAIEKLEERKKEIASNYFAK